MADHVNNIAETAPVKVRYKHAGVDVGDGTHRPMCRPDKVSFQTVKHEKDVTCPHCQKVISNFKVWMAIQEAAGRKPEGFEG